VNNFKLKRDAATFHLRSGTVCFVPPVQGNVTGAMFAGDGNMVLDPPTPDERASLKLLTKEDEFSENFSQLVPSLYRFHLRGNQEGRIAGIRFLRCRLAA